MNRFSISIIISIFYTMFSLSAFAFENAKTHPAITKEAVERSTLDDFLKNQIGLNGGLETQLELTSQFQNNINRRVTQEPEYQWDDLTTVSIKEWLKRGSSLEDVPNPRARHHFYDPIRDTGLNNSDAVPDVLTALCLGSLYYYPDYWCFDATGGSALKRSLGHADDWGVDWESELEYLIKYNWPTARNLFYSALTSEQKTDREKTLGSMFVVLGHICHLLEDMGVPAHTRNDFILGHLVTGFYKDLTGSQKPFYKGGHPFEAWMETQIANNSDQIPSAYLTRLMETPPAFSKYKDYWDTGICELSGAAQWQGDSPGWPSYSFGNPPPEKSWGLAEYTNYQFLSFSTMFKNNGLQSFPHPAKEHTRVDWYPTGPDGERQYYLLGYEVPHLAKVTYSTFYAWLIPIYTIETSTTEDERVYEDYAKRTIPRTIDYTTGLLNYFFRGKIENSVTNYDGNILEVTIKNISKNSDAAQVLKGGTFELYWDDQDGVRSPVSGTVTVYDPTSGDWGENSVLNYNSTTTMEFTPVILPEDKFLDKYVVVYKGGIQSDAGHPDSDDNQALATASFYCGELLVCLWYDGPECGEGSGWYTPVIDILNISNKSGIPQNLVGGTFNVYYTDIENQLIPLVSIPGSLDYCYECFDPEAEWPFNPVLEINLGTVNAFMVQRLVVIYDGQMAADQNPTQEYDGIATGSMNISGEIGSWYCDWGWLCGCPW